MARKSSKRNKVYLIIFAFCFGSIYVRIISFLFNAPFLDISHTSEDNDNDDTSIYLVEDFETNESSGDYHLDENKMQYSVEEGYKLDHDVMFEQNHTMDDEVDEVDEENDQDGDEDEDDDDQRDDDLEEKVEERFDLEGNQEVEQDDNSNHRRHDEQEQHLEKEHELENNQEVEQVDNLIHPPKKLLSKEQVGGENIQKTGGGREQLIKQNKTSNVPSHTSQETRNFTADNLSTTTLQNDEEDFSALPMAAPVPLNPIDKTLEPLYATGCCGIGHRLFRLVPTIVYYNRMKQQVKAVWSDVPWSALFNDTEYVQHSEKDDGWAKAFEKDVVLFNGTPEKWWSDQPWKEFIDTGHILDRYERNYFHSPMLISVLLSLRQSLSPLVLSYINPLRKQLNKARREKDTISICAHIRQGNNETGDWESKAWRHVDFDTILLRTRIKMEEIVSSQNASKAAIYVASDNANVRPWFENNVPKTWDVIQPGKSMPKPGNGVWFGEHGSTTSNVLNQTMKNEAMADATAEVFVLGECDALVIPSYSSFSYPAIALTKERGKPVFFAEINLDGYYKFAEMSTIMKSPEKNGRRRLLTEKSIDRNICDEEL